MPLGLAALSLVTSVAASFLGWYMVVEAGMPVVSKNTKRTLRPTRRAVAKFIYHYHGELSHQGLGNAFVFLDTTGMGNS